MLPPFVGVAVKVTDTPALLGLVPEVIAIETAGATDGFTLMVMLLLVAVVVVAQAPSICVPELDSDVHDLRHLAEIARWLQREAANV